LAANEGMNEHEIAKEGDWSNVQTARLYIDENTPLRQKRVLKLQKMLLISVFAFNKHSSAIDNENRRHKK